MSHTDTAITEARAYAAERGYQVLGARGPNAAQCIRDAVDFAERTPGTGDAFAQDTPYRRRHSAARIRRTPTA